MTTSPEAGQLMEDLRRRRDEPGSGQRGHDERRREIDTLGSLYPVPADVEVRPVDAGGVPSEWLVPGGAEPGALLYLHGGGYTRGSLQSHRTLAARLARASGRRALLIDYRLAPEHPCPAAVDDADAAWRWLAGQPGNQPGSIGLAGDSAGGGLTVALLERLARAGDGLPAGAVLFSPWTDLRDDAPATRVDPEIDPLLTPRDFRLSASAYLGSRSGDDPVASPALGDLRGLPPMLVFVGGREILLEDAVGLVAAARRAGVEADLIVESDLFHVWPLFAHLPESDVAVQRAGAFLRSVLS